MYKVLLVDDEILVREAMKENVDWAGLGYELVCDCQNGKEAMAFIEEREVDVVLTDICMPYIDGLELSEYLYHHHPQIAIIIFSGYGEFEYAKKAIQFRVSEYILKPVTVRELSGILTKMRAKLEKGRQQKEQLGELTKGYQAYKKNTSTIASKALSALVMGTQDTSSCLHELSELGIIIKATDYRIAVVEIDAYSEHFDTGEADKKESALMSFVVQNISEEIIHEYQMGLAFKTGDHRVFLLIQTNKPRESCAVVRKMCQSIQKHVMDAMKLQVSLGVGEYVQDIEHLYVSYESALKALNCRYMLGGGILLDMEEIKTKLEGELTIDDELNALVYALKMSDEKDIEKVFMAINETLTEHLVGRNRACLYLQQVLQKTQDVLEEVGGEQLLHTGRKDELLTRIANSRTYEEACLMVREYALWVSGYITDTHHTSGQRQAMRALDYIKENYGNQDLSLNDICTYLSISTSHFSATFKEETGETFMEVLIRTRMQKAKELLKKTTLKNYEIAERVGFSDPHYFSIAFKKMTGKTPKEYAKETC